MTFFGEGGKYGLKIKYSSENTPLGTAGPLGLLKKELNERFLLMNDDVLSSLNYRSSVEYHEKYSSTATIALARRSVNIDFGVIKLGGENITNYMEKPTIDYLVSSGVYIFEPEVLEYIKLNVKRDLPELIKKLIKDGKKVKSYVNDAYWLDIGRPEDYVKANADFEKLKERFLPK